jgi:hypothetical protein
MADRPPGGEYAEAWRVEIGWWLWLGDHWEQITGRRIEPKVVYLTAGGRVYRVGSLEAIMIRRTEPPELGPTGLECSGRSSNELAGLLASSGR